jgi:hypothetical protein
MTAARQQRKTPLAVGLTLWLAASVGIFTPPSAGHAATADRIVVNAHSGLAISGFDPVAYFTDGKPRIGRPELELTSGGAVWRFRNEGNRAAFAEHPEVYTPQFGGYDPMAVAHGNSVPGHPLFWAVVGERLYLFYSANARADFLIDPGRIIDAASRKWPTVARSIAR